MSRKRRSKSKPLPAKQPLQRSSYQTLAKLIQARTTELGLSVRALAEKLGKPRTTVHKTLCGDRRLDPIEFLDWCVALEIEDPLGFIKAVRRH